ncbi:hypothetical protein GcM1_050003, partial [Golovinomyces cichoracearum]
MDKKSIAGNLIALINYDEPLEWPKSDKDYHKIVKLINTDPIKYTEYENLKEPRFKSRLEARGIPKRYTIQSDIKGSREANQRYTSE